MRYGTLSNAELLRFAEQDARYGTDPLFTELVARVGGAPRGNAANTLRGESDHRVQPLLTDARDHVRA